MDVSQAKHTDPVCLLIEQVELDRKAMLKLGGRVMGVPGTPMFPLDLMAFAAVKRNISTARAFSMMIESWNMLCARSLLRIHIDTSLRFSAAWLVDNPHDFATRVLQGERVDRIKDKAGMQLSDTYLVNASSKEYPWLPDVYKNLSGYVHFSSAHIFGSVADVGHEDRTVSFEIADTDFKFPEFSWVEVLECFREASAILAKYLHGYALTKCLSPSELEAAKTAEPRR